MEARPYELGGATDGLQGRVDNIGYLCGWGATHSASWPPCPQLSGKAYNYHGPSGSLQPAVPQ